TTAATPFFATSSTKSWPSNLSPLMAKNTSPGCACRESVQTRRTSVSPEPRNSFPLHASTMNFSGHASMYFSKKVAVLPGLIMSVVGIGIVDAGGEGGGLAHATGQSGFVVALVRVD